MLRIIYDADEINSLMYSDVLKRKIITRLQMIEGGEYKVGTNLEVIKTKDPMLFSARVDGHFRILLTPKPINGKPGFRYLGLTPHNYNLPLITNHPDSVIARLDSNENQKIENTYLTALAIQQIQEAEKNRILPKAKTYLINDPLHQKFYDNKWILLNDKQKQLLEIVQKKGLPFVLTGAPGSGKTMLALMFTGLTTDVDNVMFFPPSDDLLEDVQKQFEGTECSKVLTQEEKDKIIFANIKKLLSKYFSPDKIVNEKTHCQNWIAKQIEVKKNLKELPLNFSTSTECINKLFSEFRIISGFYYPDKDKKGYINNNQISLFLSEEEKDFAWGLYDKYYTDLEENELAHPDFTPLPIDTKEDVIIIIDECQQLSLMRIKNLIEKARGRVFIAINPDQNCNDDNVSKLEFVKTILNLLTHKKVDVFALPYTYRLPENVLEAANIILQLTRFIDQGTTADGQQNEIESIMCNQDIPGIVNWFNSSQVSLEDLRKLTARADCAVVTLPEFVDEARRELGTENVFTPDQIVGLQFPYIVSYKYFSSKQYHEMLKEISTLISETPASVILGGNKIHRTKERSKKSNAFWSKLYVLITRASQAVIFYDDVPNDLENENKRKIENVLFHLYKFLVEHTATKEKIDFNKIEIDDNTLKEAWIELIKKYLAQGRIELAKNNFLSSRVKGTLEEFEALKAVHAKVKANSQVSVEVKTKETVSSDPIKIEEKKTTDTTRIGTKKTKQQKNIIISETPDKKAQAFEEANQAAMEGDITIVRKYLKNKIDQNTIKQLFYNALEAGQVKVVELLLQQGPSLINLRLKENKTPLYIAAEAGQHFLVQFLLASGAEVSQIEKPIQSKSKNKKNIIILKPIDIAIENLNLPIIESLLHYGLHLSNASINSLLNKAAARNQLTSDILKEAVKNGCSKLVKLLLNRGWEKCLTKPGLESFMTMLIEEAAQRGHLSIIKMLFAFAPTAQNLITTINTRVDENKNLSPVGAASANGHIDVVRFLLKQGVKAVPNNQHNTSPIQSAANKGHTEIVKLLVKYGAEEIYKSDETIISSDHQLKAKEEKLQTIDADILPYVTQLLETGDVFSFISTDHYQSLSDKRITHLFFIAPFSIDVANEIINVTIFESIFNDINKKNQFLNACLIATSFNHSFLLHIFPNDLSSVSQDLEEQGKIKSCQLKVIQWLLENDVDVMSVIISPAFRLGNVSILDSLFSCNAFGPKTALPISLLMDLNLLSTKELPLNKDITPLMIAASYGHLDLVKYLLQIHKIGTNTRSASGHSALSFAVENGHIEVVKYLLQEKADPNVTIEGVSLIDIALEKENDECILLLETYGAKIEKKPIKEKTQHKNIKEQKNKPLPLQKPKTVDVQDVPPPILKTPASPPGSVSQMITPSNQENLPEQTKSNNEGPISPLTEYESELFKFKTALKYGYHEVVKDILKKTSYLNELMNETIDEMITNGINIKLTPIAYAANQGYTLVVEVLIKQNIKGLKRDELLQSLNYAASKNNLKLVKLLLKHVVLDCKNFKDNLSLYFAAKKGHAEVVKALIGHGINISTLKEALFCAIQERKIKVIEVLLEADILKDEKSFINMPIKNNKTLLQMAIEDQQEKMVKFLLHYGADPYAPPSDDPDMDHNLCLVKLLGFAAISQNLKIMDMLLSKEQMINDASLVPLLKRLKYLDEDVTDLKKVQAITDLTEKAAQGGYLNILRICLRRLTFQKNVKEMKEIILKLIDISANKDQAPVIETIFKFRFMDERDKVVQLKNEIIKQLNTLTGIKNTIYIASYYGFYDVIKNLLLHGVSVDPKQESTDIPLFCAVESGRIEVARLLIQNGADINLRTNSTDGNYTTALSIAVNKNNKVMVALLLNQKNLNPNHIVGNNLFHVLHLAVDIAFNSGDTTILKMLLKDDRVKRNITIKKYNLTPRQYALSIGSDVEVIKLFDTIKPAPKVYSNDNQISFEDTNLERIEIDADVYLNKILNEGNEPNFIGSAFYRLLSSKKIIELFFLEPFTFSPSNGQEEITITFCKYIFKDEAREDKLIDKLLTDDSQNTPYLFKLFPNNLSELFICPETKTHIEDEQKIILLWLSEREDIMQTVLVPALCAGNIAIVNALIELNLFDPNAPLPLSILLNQHFPFSRGTTPLMLASEKGQLEMVQFLLNKQVDANSVSIDGVSSLYLAAKCGHCDVVSLLLHYGPKINTTLDIFPFLSAIDNQAIDLVKIFINHYENNREIIKIRDLTDENEPLIYAVRFGTAEIVDTLLIHNINKNIDEAFKIAILQGPSAIEIVKVILKYINIPKEQQCLIAAENDNQPAVNACLEHFKQLSSRTTLLHLAIKSGREDLVKKFLLQSMNINATDGDDCTPLHYAVYFGHVNIVKMLLEDTFINLDIQNQNNETARDLAVSRDDDVGKQMIEYLDKKENQKEWKKKPQNQKITHFEKSRSNQEEKNTQKTKKPIINSKKNSPANSQYINAKSQQNNK